LGSILEQNRINTRTTAKRKCFLNGNIVWKLDQRTGERLKLLESEFEKGELFSGNERELNNLRNKRIFPLSKKVVELKAV